MSAVGLILILSLMGLLVIGAPISVSMGSASFAGIMASGTIPPMVFVQRMFTTIDSFPLMSIIFFIMSGEMMLQGGISRRLINFSLALFGHFRGSLAIVAVVTCAFFGAISGSSLATVAAIGGVMYPEMVKNGYSEDFSGSLVATSGMLGVLIPPSIPLIVYGILTGTSIGDLFLAIVATGFLFTFLYIICALIIIRRRGMAPLSQNPQKVSLGKSFKEAVWGLMSPVIILGGIYSGVFTPTESAVAALVYSLLIGLVVYRELNWRIIYQVIGKSVIASAAIMLIVACAQLFSWVLTAENIPQMVSELIIQLTSSKVGFLLLCNLIYLIAGMFIETQAVQLLLVPLLFPVAQSFGIDPLHFGIITVSNLAVGMITPPFGANLFVCAGVSKLPLQRLFRGILPFVITGFIGVLVVTFMPSLSVGFLSLIK